MMIFFLPIHHSPTHAIQLIYHEIDPMGVKTHVALLSSKNYNSQHFRKFCLWACGAYKLTLAVTVTSWRKVDTWPCLMIWWPRVLKG